MPPDVTPGIAEQDIIKFLLINLPLVSIIVVASWRGLIDINARQTEKDHDEELARRDEETSKREAEHQRESEFREKLRQEALNDKKAMEERSVKLADSLKELTDVVREALEFNGRLIEEFQRREPKSNDARRTRSNPRTTRPRT